jgi:hypothetical protein
VRLYSPFDQPVVLGHHTPDGVVDYTLPANSEVTLPDDVGERALARYEADGLVRLNTFPLHGEDGDGCLDCASKLEAESRYRAYLVRLSTHNVGTLYGPRTLVPQSDHEHRLFDSLQKRGLIHDPPEG